MTRSVNPRGEPTIIIFLGSTPRMEEGGRLYLTVRHLRRFKPCWVQGLTVVVAVAEAVAAATKQERATAFENNQPSSPALGGHYQAISIQEDSESPSP